MLNGCEISKKMRSLSKTVSRWLVALDRTCKRNKENNIRKQIAGVRKTGISLVNLILEKKMNEMYEKTCKVEIL